MPVCFSKCEVNIYADDTAFYFSAKSVQEVSQVLQSELESVFRWLLTNKLSLHIGKTNSMLICSQQKRLHLENEDLCIHLENKNIDQVKSIKYLGLTIDEKLKYDEYMKCLFGKLNRSIGVLRRASKYIDQISRVTLFNTLVLPHIDYCSTVWSNCITGKAQMYSKQRYENHPRMSLQNS